METPSHLSFLLPPAPTPEYRKRDHELPAEENNQRIVCIIQMAWMIQLFQVNFTEVVHKWCFVHF